MIVPGECLITGPCPLRLQLESTIPPEYVRVGAGVGKSGVGKSVGGVCAASNELAAISRIIASVFIDPRGLVSAVRGVFYSGRKVAGRATSARTRLVTP
jgi:hypothetical protein